MPAEKLNKSKIKYSYAPRCGFYFGMYLGNLIQCKDLNTVYV